MDSSSTNEPKDPIDDVTSTDFYIEEFVFLNTGKSPDDPVTVTFHTQDESIYTHTFTAKENVGNIKEALAAIFAVPERYIGISKNTKNVKDNMRLMDFNLGEFMNIELNLSSTVWKYRMCASKLYMENKEPDIITVRVQTDDDAYKDVVVEVIDRSIEKPFLGGYYHKVTGFDYHNAYSQTGPPDPKVSAELKNHRDTQTYWLRNRKLDTEYEHATQMCNAETWIPSITDKILTAGQYETADERKKRLNIEGNVRTIQKYFWRWRLNKALRVLTAEYRRRIAEEEAAEAFFLKDDEDRKKREINAKVFPRSKADFCMLYAMVDRWKKSEIDRISTMCTTAPKIAAFYMLLEKEIKMLSCIENHRKQVLKDVKVQKEIEFFKTIGDPLVWDHRWPIWNGGHRDIRISMDTIETQRGRQFKNMYSLVRNRNLSTNERIEALISLKLLLKNHHCDLITELINLIDRECELQVRDMKGYYLEVLQQKIESLLMRHFSSSVSDCGENVPNRMRRVKEKVIEKNLYFCSRCSKYKLIEEFTVDSKTDKLRICSVCLLKDRVQEPWIDIAPYRYMLRQIRRDERLRGCQSSVAFILQEKDIHFIVMRVWHGHSFLSECSNMPKLRLCRWDVKKDWSPWNCVLLTYDEARIHLKIKVLQDVYSPDILQTVYTLHSLAKQHFCGARYHDAMLQSRAASEEIEWYNLTDLVDFVAVNSKTKVFLSCH